MELEPTSLDGVYLIVPRPVADERGTFVRLFDRDVFAAQGLVADWAQASVSTNRGRGTVRGLHFQAAPHQEAKLVRCTAGAVFDVVVDLRPSSPTRGRWVGMELSARNQRQLYLPVGVAHGFQTLEDHSEVTYWISVAYFADAGRGHPHDDPAFGIRWPLPVTCISERDRAWPRYEAGARPC